MTPDERGLETVPMDGPDAENTSRSHSSRRLRFDHRPQVGERSLELALGVPPRDGLENAVENRAGESVSGVLNESGSPVFGVWE
ncbi:hypothetical protein [Halomontanus rarus]|uniref:hypothetical protein n=1 Tax=Halomontanus rarus TaxID=3034020 RepID=UPI0023E79FFA|nr:hypothetical protein [Halovivax sp. TS33]